MKGTKTNRQQADPDTTTLGANMPHLTNTGATAALDGARPSEVETDEIPTDDAAASHQASPAKNTTNTRATGTRKAGSKATRTKTNASTGSHSTGITKVTTAGRRKKLFDTTKAQAAYERLQDLKQAHSSVQKALKAPLNELADRSIAELLEDPAAIERTPQYTETRQFLDSRLADQQRQVNDRHRVELEMARHVLDAEIDAVNRSANVSATCFQLLLLSILTQHPGPNGRTLP